MRLSKVAIMAIKGNRMVIVPKIAAAIDRNEQVVYRYIRSNSDELTKAAALKVIREETGLTDEQILEENEPEPARA